MSQCFLYIILPWKKMLLFECTQLSLHWCWYDFCFTLSFLSFLFSLMCCVWLLDVKTNTGFREFSRVLLTSRERNSIWLVICGEFFGATCGVFQRALQVCQLLHHTFVDLTLFLELWYVLLDVISTLLCEEENLLLVFVGSWTEPDPLKHADLINKHLVVELMRVRMYTTLNATNNR